MSNRIDTLPNPASSDCHHDKAQTATAFLGWIGEGLHRRVLDCPRRTCLRLPCWDWPSAMRRGRLSRWEEDYASRLQEMDCSKLKRLARNLSARRIEAYKPVHSQRECPNDRS